MYSTGWSESESKCFKSVIHLNFFLIIKGVSEKSVFILVNSEVSSHNDYKKGGGRPRNILILSAILTFKGRHIYIYIYSYMLLTLICTKM